MYDPSERIMTTERESGVDDPLVNALDNIPNTQKQRTSARCFFAVCLGAMMLL